jgi:hypothetical protein
MDGFDQQLQLEKHERTLFVFYGYRWASTHKFAGKFGSGYQKLANSLREAMADLQSNSGILDEGGYFVRDAILEVGDGDAESPVLHVELVSVRELVEHAKRTM